MTKEQLRKLILSCQNLELKSQKVLFEYYSDIVFFAVRRYIKDEYYVQNLVQDVFIKVFNNLDKYDEQKGAFSTWVTTISIRLAISFLRKKNLKYENIDDELGLQSTSLDVLAILNAADILKVLDNISDQNRIIFCLYEIDGYRHKEISRILRISESSSRTYLTRAKKQIQLQLTDLGLAQNYSYEN